VKIRYCDGASFAGHPESEVRIDLCFAPFVVNFYTFGFMLMFFLKLFYIAERKWVVLQRPGHMGSYYG